MDKLNQAHKDGVVIGLKEVSGVGVRQDIDKMLLEQPDTFNLMIIALLELMVVEVPWEIDPEYATKTTDKFSWFEMAGIHGLPLRDWDGVAARPKSGDNDETGYCVHGYPTFESWHRPYLAMLEQTLYRQIQNVADRFSRSKKVSDLDKEKYRTAAKLFRLPYYDYFRARDYSRLIPGVRQPDKGGRKRNTAMMNWTPYDFSLPQIFTMPKLMIKSLPDNNRMLIRNPFFQYRLPKDGFTPDEWARAGLDPSVPATKEKTMRYGSDKQRSVGWMNDNLNKIREDTLRLVLSMIEPGVYDRLDVVTTSNVITTTSAQPAADAAANPKDDKNPDSGIATGPSGSLEAVHNDYHVYLGGFVGDRSKMSGKVTFVGHMTSVPVSGFDPVFWIHHCQIDRLFAIWQTANPKSWFESLPPAYRNLQDAPMYPFRRAINSENPETDWWTPNLTRECTDLGYTYPDVKKADGSAAEIRKNFIRDYAWSRRLKPGVKVGDDQRPPAHMKPLDVSKAQIYSFETGSTEEYLFETLAPEPEPEIVTALLDTGVSFDEPHIDEPSYEWYIDDRVRRLAKNGSFTIFYIIDPRGVYGETGSQWVSQAGFVGLTHIFAAPVGTCSNCERQDKQGTIVTSTTPITSLLLDYVESGRLTSLKPDDVKPFLIKSLKWRVQTSAGDLVNPRALADKDDFKVSVSCKTAPILSDDQEVDPKDVKYDTYDDVIQSIIHNSS